MAHRKCQPLASHPRRRNSSKLVGPEDTTLSQFAEHFFKEIQQRDHKYNTMLRRYPLTRISTP